MAHTAAFPPTSGSPLPEEIRARMEPAFGADFSSVRTHDSSSAASIGALAYTQGSDLSFGPGSYAPTGGGQELLGHELAHVVQQREGRVNPFIGQY